MFRSLKLSIGKHSLPCVNSEKLFFNLKQYFYEASYGVIAKFTQTPAHQSTPMKCFYMVW